MRYLITFDRPMFIIGFKLMSMIYNEVYVTLEPLEGLADVKVSELKELRRELSKYSYNFFCQTDTAEGLRFAQFFGFRQTKFAWGRAHLVKEQM